MAERRGAGYEVFASNSSAACDALARRWPYPQSQGRGRDAWSNFANRAVRGGIFGDRRSNCAFCEVEPPIGWQWRAWPEFPP